MHLYDLLWTLLAIGFIVGYFMVLFRVALDVFRSDDLPGWGKGVWFVVLLVLPLVPLLVYVATRGRAMTGRERSRRAGIDSEQISG